MAEKKKTIAEATLQKRRIAEEVAGKIESKQVVKTAAAVSSKPRTGTDKSDKVVIPTPDNPGDIRSHKLSSVALPLSVNIRKQSNVVTEPARPEAIVPKEDTVQIRDW